MHSNLMNKLLKLGLANPNSIKPVSRFEAYERISKSDFCPNIIQRLSKEFKDEFQNHEFFVWDFQPQDIHIAWGKKHPVVVQIDAEIGVLCSFGVEYGESFPEDDPIEELIKQYYKNIKPSN